MLQTESVLAYGSSFGSTLGNTSLDDMSDISGEEVDSEVIIEAEVMTLLVKSSFFGEFGERGIKGEASELVKLVEDASAPSCKSTVG